MSIRSTDHRYHIEKRAQPMKLKELTATISKNPIRLWIFVFAIAAIGAFIYYSTTEVVYQCQTKTGGGISRCYKFKVYPPPTEFVGIVANTECPYNPPSNCP